MHCTSVNFIDNKIRYLLLVQNSLLFQVSHIDVKSLGVIRTFQPSEHRKKGMLVFKLIFYTGRKVCTIQTHILHKKKGMYYSNSYFTQEERYASFQTQIFHRKKGMLVFKLIFYTGRKVCTIQTHILHRKKGMLDACIQTHMLHRKKGMYYSDSFFTQEERYVLFKLIFYTGRKVCYYSNS